MLLNSIARRALRVQAVKRAVDAPINPKKAPAKTSSDKAATQPKEDRLKRAPSAFNLFVKDVFPVIKKANPGLDFTGASKKVREQWLQSSQEAKAPYEKEAAKLKAIVDAKRAEEKAKARPPGSYILFVKKNRSSVVAANPGKTAMEVGKLLGQMWRQLPAEEQQKYKEEAQALLATWKSTHGAATSS